MTNANVFPSSSESEGEAATMTKNFRTRLPILADRWGFAGRAKGNEWTNAVGLGIGLGGLRDDSEIHKMPVHEVTVDDDDSSVYDDQEPEPETERTNDTAEYDHLSQSRPSIEKLDEAHRKRREALMGIVNGLELGLGSTFVDDTRPDESDYCGQEGLAISGSGDMACTGGMRRAYHVRQDQDRPTIVFDHNQGVNSEDEDDRKRGIGVGSVAFGTSAEDRHCKRNVAQSMYLSPGHSLSHPEPQPLHGDYPPKNPSPRSGPRFQETSSHSAGSRGRISKSPIIRQNADVVIPAALRRHSVYEAQEPKTTTHNLHREEPVCVNFEQTYTRDTEIPNQPESSHAAAARERKAFGIPPSESDGIFQHGMEEETSMLPHTDSVMSSVESTLWLEECEELSVGAEELFRKLGGKYQKTAGDLPLRNTEDDLCLPEPPSEGGRWRSTLSTAIYKSLLGQYGELEMQRQEVIWELWESEKVFVKGMRAMVGLFIRPLRVKNTRMWISGVPSDVARLFDWLEDIVNLHKQILSVLQASLDEQSPVVKHLAASMRSCLARLEVYQPYIVRLEEATGTIKHLRQDPGSDFGEFMKIQERAADHHGWSLESFLTEPLNRLTRYPDFFKVSNPAMSKIVL